MRFPAALLLALPIFGIFASLCFVSVCWAAPPPVQDIFVGNGTPGPFALSWNSVQLNTETVTVNQQTQLRNLDYTLDAAAGTLTFTHALPTSAAIEVTYAITPGLSQRTGSGQTIPL